MRTTLNLDDDVLLAVKELAKLRGSTAGEVLSELARDALRPTDRPGTTRNGVPILEPVDGSGIVTSEHVAELLDDA